MPDYGSSRKAWRIRNFGDSALALELLRLEEHSFYILIFKMAATKAALSPTLFPQPPAVIDWHWMVLKHHGEVAALLPRSRKGL